MTSSESDGEQGGEQPSLEDLLTKIERSPLGPLLQDEKAAERMMFDFMTRSDNEVLREMGRGLRDGNISLQSVGEIEAYREAISGGFDQLGQLDFGAISEQLDEVIAEQEQRDAGNDETSDRNSFDEEEDVFQGLWGNRGGPW